MGAGESSLADYVLDGDVPALKALLGDRGTPQDDAAWAREVEEAVHTAVALEITTAQELQQAQIALELLLRARPAAWSSRLTAGNCLGPGDDEDADADNDHNSADWTASHRACVTGNLAFVAFVRQRFATFDVPVRDAFGLLPIDLVPPELLRTPEEVAADLAPLSDESPSQPQQSMASARDRRNAALQWLRSSKAAFEAQQLAKLLQQPVVDPGESFVVLEASRERLDSRHITGHVHDRTLPLRVRFRLPKAEPVEHGYFQLVWRAPGEPRSEEPHYEPHVLRLRDELERQHDEPPPVDPKALETPDEVVVTRRLVDEAGGEADDQETVIEGTFPLSVPHLPEGSVAHVLFVACDHNMLHRSVVLSTEGVLLLTANGDELDEFADGGQETEAEESEEEEMENENGFLFLVGGEEFRHPNEVFAGREFEDVAELEAFVKEQCANRRRKKTETVSGDSVRMPVKRVEKEDEKAEATRPSEPTDSVQATAAEKQTTRGLEEPHSSETGPAAA